MLTFIFLFAGVVLVIGLVILVMRSGTKGGRHGQSGRSAVSKQEDRGGPGRPVV